MEPGSVRPPPSPLPPPQQQRPAASLVRRVFRKVGGKVKTSLAAVGLITTISLAAEYRRLKAVHTAGEADSEKGEEKKKRVLVIPFHRLHLVDHKGERNWRMYADEWRGAHDPMTVEVGELVTLLHRAASDPTVTALYGYFGHGSHLASAGWADLEEVRNALKVVRQSHLRHLEPNVAYQAQIIPRVAPKPLYAYADSFVNPADPGNKDYYLASAFSHVHLQRRGEWNCLGLVSQNIFIRGLLEQYGVQVHVFAQGAYKTWPNMLTEYGLNRPHRENVTDLIQTLDADICQEMAASRAKKSSSSSASNTKQPNKNTWQQQVHSVGTLSALQAWKQGLVDYLPRRDPLDDLVASNQNEESKALQKMAWKLDETDFGTFEAQKTVTLSQYAREWHLLQKRQDRLEHLQQWGTKYPAFGRLLSFVGLADKSDFPAPVKDRISVIHLGGTIDHATASQTVQSIRKIRKQDSVKAVVLRVSSPGGVLQPCETIAQELKSLTVPLIVSFGNTAASGGYYVAADADRIFSSRKTLTGSIGVFGIRPDLTQLAARYGVTAQHVAVGDLSAMSDPLHPMTRPMKQNFAACIDRYYAQFKRIVSRGRDLDDDHVESIAQGRVYTGDQAKSNGLVDELGGLHRAIAYAKRNFASDDAKVDVWPKEKKFWEMWFDSQDSSLLFAALSAYLRGQGIQGDAPLDFSETHGIQGILDWIVRSSSLSTGVPGTLSSVMLTANEDSAIRCYLEQAAKIRNSSRQRSLFPPWFWE